MPSRRTALQQLALVGGAAGPLAAGRVWSAPAAPAAPVTPWPIAPIRILLVYPPGGVSDVAARALAELLSQALATPVRVDYRPGASGSLGLEALASAAPDGHIPYKGGGQQLGDALAGQFELLSTNVGGLQLSHIRSGKFKPLAVGAPQRLAALPQVPTWAELGYPLANLASVFGLFAPAGTPAAVLDRLNAEVNRALGQATLRNPLLAADNLPTGGSADDFAALIKREQAQHRALLRQVVISLD